jgi:hypothetical protein
MRPWDVLFPCGPSAEAVLLFGSLAILLHIVAYRAHWSWRFRRPVFPVFMGTELIRVQGTVVGPGPSGSPVYLVDREGFCHFASPFALQDLAGRRHDVLPEGAVLEMGLLEQLLGELRGVCVGDRLTLDALRAEVRRDESLYRESTTAPALDAVRIARGAWPELRWLRYPAFALGGLGLAALCAVVAPDWTIDPDEAPRVFSSVPEEDPEVARATARGIDIPWPIQFEPPLGFFRVSFPKRESVRLDLRELVGSLPRCYEEQVWWPEDLPAPTAAVHIVIEPGGRVSSAATSTEQPGSRGIADCITKEVQRYLFAPLLHGGPVNVIFTVIPRHRG